MTSVPLESVPFSELLRQPVETAERLTRTRAVRLRRRDAVDLVLMSADRAEAESEVIDITARLLATIVGRDPGLVATALPTVVPWVRFLPAEDVTTLVAEFIDTVEAAGMLGNTAPVSQLLTEWRHTAEIYADPELYRALTARTLGDFGAVPRPADA
jgi:hypothetical protein